MDYYLELVSQIFKVSESDNTKIFILTMEFQWDLSNVAADNSGNLGLIFYCFLWENISVEDQVQIKWCVAGQSSTSSPQLQARYGSVKYFQLTLRHDELLGLCNEGLDDSNDVSRWNYEW